MGARIPRHLYWYSYSRRFLLRYVEQYVRQRTKLTDRHYSARNVRSCTTKAASCKIVQNYRQILPRADGRGEGARCWPCLLDSTQHAVAIIVSRTHRYGH